MKKILHIRWIFLSVIFLSFCFASEAQQADAPIVLNNPSLEGTSKAGTPNGRAPRGWIDCSHVGQSAVDIQPGFFDVYKPAQSGDSYVGMVVRADDTWEGISQRLRTPLKPETCYTFKIHLARSEKYNSLTNLTGKEENFANPTKLRIYGGNNFCSKNELLAESQLIAHSEWKEYEFKFDPISAHTHILLEVFYRTPSLFPYNGNLLIDNLSSIVPISCDEEVVEEKEINPPIVNILNPANDGLQVENSTFNFSANFANVPSKRYVTFLVNGNEHSFNFSPTDKSITSEINFKQRINKIQVIASTPDGTSQETRRVYYNASIAAVEEVIPPGEELGWDVSNLFVGKVLPLKNVYFLADSTRIEKDNYQILEGLKKFLDANAGINVEIMGHTNNRCREDFCLTLSEKRARAVVGHLRSIDVDSNRLTYKGYGSSKPIASNDSSKGRQRNQRVEVKITKLPG